jgi:protease-4
MTDPGTPEWERIALERVALQAIQEQRRARQWNALFKLLWFTFAFLVLAAMLGWIGRGESEPGSRTTLGKHTAVVDVEGVISAEDKASAERLIKGLNRAFKDANTAGVVVRINSPGGSPVQAGQVNDEIRRLRAKYPSIPLHAVVEDVCASGGYYIAVAADKIYVDKASIVGSIGVIAGGFGFVGAIEKLGIERRVYKSGDNKDFLDAFQPERAEERARMQALLKEVHEQFVKVVRDGRGKRLNETPEMFQGFFWTGEKSIELGLADAIGSTEFVAREVFQAEKLVNYTLEENYFEALSKRLGAALGETFVRAAASAASKAALEVR